MAAMFFITLVVIAFWVVNILVNISMAGISGWSLPLQDLERYRASPYSLSVWQYCTAQILTNLIGCIVFGLFILMLSVWNKSILVVFFVGGIVFSIPFLVRNISELSIAWGIKNLFFTEFMRVENMFSRARSINYGDWTIRVNILFFYFYTCSLAALFMEEIYRSFKKYQPSS
jgi:hypothetical protein